MRGPITTAVSAAAIVGSIADAEAIDPIDQARGISTFVNAQQCGPDFLGDEISATGFEPFDAFVQTEHSCDSGAAFAFASQQSQIGAASIIAAGLTMSEAQGPVFGVVHAFATSSVSVTFGLAAPCSFSLTGQIEAGATDDPIVVLNGAEVSLTGPGGTVLTHSVNAGPGGETNVEVLDDGGALAPGQYTLEASAGTFIDNEVPPAKLTDASFDFLFNVTKLGDLDRDGMVGVTDLLLLLAAFGPCPDPPATCPADLDGDGNVGVTDLLIMLANWG